MPGSGAVAEESEMSDAVSPGRSTMAVTRRNRWAFGVGTVAALVLLAVLLYLLLRRNRYEDRPLGARAVSAAAK